MELRQGLVQVPVALDRTNGGELFSMGEFASMAIYAIKMPKLEVNDNLVALQQGRSQLCSENIIIIKYDVLQSSMKSSILEEDVNVAHYTTPNASIKMF